MRRGIELAGLAVIVAIIVVAVTARSKGPAKNQFQPTENTSPSFSGQIMDSACAAVGSHTDMMTKYNFKSEQDCVRDCMTNKNATLVLYVPATKTTYKLDDQDRPKQYLGQNVTIVGSYDQLAQVIHIQTIQAVQ
jgi:hypothetical protein